MKVDNDLHIYEEIMLLALRDKKGTMHFGVHYQFAISGAIIAELLLTEKIEIEGKKKLVRVINSKQIGDSILDECLTKIRTSSRQYRIETWVKRFANLSKLKHRAAHSLCLKGILKMEEDQVLLIFKRKSYPEINPKPEKLILNKLEEAIFTDTDNVDAETIILISICNSAGMLKPLFDNKKLRSRKNRIKQITDGSVVGKATKSAVEAMQAAVMVTAIMPAMIVATTSH